MTILRAPVPDLVIPAKAGIHCPGGDAGDGGPESRHSREGGNPLPWWRCGGRGALNLVIPVKAGIHCPGGDAGDGSPESRHSHGSGNPLPAQSSVCESEDKISHSVRYFWYDVNCGAKTTKPPHVSAGGGRYVYLKAVGEAL